MRALFDRFPGLADSIPIADLGVTETPVERWQLGGTSLLIKRDDLSAPLLGGNKVRALEFLLAGLKPGDVVMTAGATGSTHALSVARFAERLGATTRAMVWPQQEHHIARATSTRMRELADVRDSRSVSTAYLRIALARLASRRLTWIPAGASVPLGALGHVSAALELASQLARDGVALPRRLVVPLGSGGTTAGLLAGLAIAGADIDVVGVRVVPRLVANRARVLRLARAAHALVQRHVAERLPAIDARRLILDGSQFGDGYGHVTAEATAAARALVEAGGPTVEGTYSAKALAAALALARRLPDEGVLFWLTFDARWLEM